MLRSVPANRFRCWKKTCLLLRALPRKLRAHPFGWQQVGNERSRKEDHIERDVMMVSVYALSPKAYNLEFREVSPFVAYVCSQCAPEACSLLIPVG
ncbi:hypothetical protein WG66_010629 [Moniliophthora roreri]|nr:hypothetical protein WG66_010629 [Moniliophthora roreri]